MVSFKTLLSFASLAVVCSGYSHGLHKRNVNHPRNLTPYYPTGTGYEKPYYPTGTGYEKPYYPTGTGYEKPYYPTGTGYETPDYPSVTDSPVAKDYATTTCVTETETKTYTYTLGNGHAITTCHTKTHVYTKTISAEEPPCSDSSTMTSTSTYVVYETHSSNKQWEYDQSHNAPNHEHSCVPTTVYLPASTVYITVTASPQSTYAPPPPPPVYTDKSAHHGYGHGPYNNSTYQPASSIPCTSSTTPVTSNKYVTVVPVPYN